MIYCPRERTIRINWWKFCYVFQNIELYGVKSRGYQTETGLRETAKLAAKEYPLINQIIQNEIYVVDCLSEENT